MKPGYLDFPPIVVLVCVAGALAALPHGAVPAPAAESAPPAPDWPQWRGPHRDGVALGAMLPEAWPEKLPLRWRAPSGPGYSTPVVTGGRVFFMERRGASEVVRALEADTGKEVWQTPYDAPYEAHAYAARHGTCPKSTTTVTGGRVYSFGISGILCALDAATGKLLWKRDLGKEFGSMPLFGASASPLVEKTVENTVEKAVEKTGGKVVEKAVANAGENAAGKSGGDGVEEGLVILPVGHKESGGALMAFEVDTGEIAWRSVKDGPSYSSPIAVDLAGVRQVVALTAKHLVGVALAGGKELWSYRIELPFDETIVTPMVWRERIILAGRSQGGTRALRLRRDGDSDSIVAEEVWKQAAPVYMTSPVISEDLLFAVEHQTGKFFCLRLEDGSLAWKDGNFGDYASLVLVGKRILVLDSRGSLTVLAATADGLRKLGGSKVSDASTYAHLVVVGSRLYVRDEERIQCFDFARAAEDAGRGATEGNPQENG